MTLSRHFNYQNKIWWQGIIVGLAVSGVAVHAIRTKTRHVREQQVPITDSWTAAQDKAILDPQKDAAWKNWLASLEDLRGKPLTFQAVEVNRRVNALMTYAEDRVIYNSDDYWAAPAESLHHKKGDCEDFAILTYESLRHLGVPDERCGVMLFKTKNAQGEPSGHAATLVDVSDERGYICFLVLDLKNNIRDLQKIPATEMTPAHVVNRSTSHPYPGR
jgi:predicted transglutaminase-like cysteine proteinase